MSHKTKGIPFSLSVGRDFKSFTNLKAIFQSALKEYDFVLLPLVHPMQYRTDRIDSLRRVYPLTYSGPVFPPLISRVDSLLRSADWQLVVGKTSTNLISCDSPHQNVRRASEYILAQELQLAIHYGLGGVLLPRVGKDCFNFAHVVSQV